MNPLKWKSEHQIALLVCSGIGFILGSIFELHEISTYGYKLYWSVDNYNDHSINFYWTIVGIVGLFGAIIGAAIIYVVQLMRR
jgi:hypothetical protein